MRITSLFLFSFILISYQVSPNFILESANARSNYKEVAAKDYYSSVETNEFQAGNDTDDDLLDGIQYASNRNFRALGYKRGAKNKLFGQVDLQRDENGYFVYDVYCGRIVRNKVGPNRIPGNNDMNTEHTWPQSKGAGSEPKRADLHHLFPTDSKANSVRGNNIFAEVSGKSAHSNCTQSETGRAINPETGRETGTRAFQPPPEHRGNVARALFYFATKYNYHISDLEEFYLRKWHREDPVDADEIQRNTDVQEVQGNRNPFIDFPETVDRISDF